MNNEIVLKHYLREDSLDRENKRVVSTINALREWVGPILTFIIILLCGLGYLHYPNLPIFDLLSLLLAKR